MREDRMGRVFRVLRGALAAGAITLLLMAGITLLVIYLVRRHKRKKTAKAEAALQKEDETKEETQQ